MARITNLAVGPALGATYFTGGRAAGGVVQATSSTHAPITAAWLRTRSPGDEMFVMCCTNPRQGSQCRSARAPCPAVLLPTLPPMNTSLTTADGLALHVRHWPADAPARGTVLIVHGLGEHTMRYQHVARHLNERGWNVVGYDHRGHGRSGGAKGVLTHADDLVRDLAAVIDAVRAHHDGPLVLLGHSLGGLIAAR